MIGGLDGAGLERFGQFTKVVKGDLEIFIIPPRTCVVLKKNERVALFPNLSIASYHVGIDIDNDLLMAADIKIKPSKS